MNSPVSLAPKLLLGCGLVSSALYIAADVYAWTQYPGYSPVSQAFSELLAEGAPTRRLMLVLEAPYNPLVAALGLGVWLSAGGKRIARLTAALLVLYALVSFLGGTFFQMDTRDVEGSVRTVVHTWVTAAMVLTLLLAVGTGAFARGPRFRAYSIGTLLTILVFAGLSFQQVGQLSAHEPAPWLGLIERVNIYAWMVWVAALALSFWPSRGPFHPEEAAMAKRALTDTLSEPLDGATIAAIVVDSRSGNLTIDQLPDDENVLASGTLEYSDPQGRPTRSLHSKGGRASLTLTGGGTGRPRFRFPWDACNGATEWRIHLNPLVRSHITAHTGGGNLKLALAGMAVSRLEADSGGGNLDVVLPEKADNLSASARTGAGNVSLEIGGGLTGRNTVEASSGAGNVAVRLPRGLAARVHADSGLGKVIVEPSFSQLDRDTYQTSDYDEALHRVDITLHSGAGNVSVSAT